MENSFIVGGFYPCNNLAHDRRRSLRTYRPFAAQQVIESFALNVFHHEKENSVGALSEISDVDDVGMSNGRGRACFALESSDGFTFLKIFVAKNVRPHCLYGDASCE